MKRILIAILVLGLVLSIPAGSYADDKFELSSEEYYVVGGEENTFQGLYQRMCVNLDIETNPIPEPELEGSKYGTGDFEKIKIIKDDDETLEYIGYVYNKENEPAYIIRYWIGYHEHGELIGMTVYYTIKGQYIGNIQRDYTNGLSNSSSRMPYYIPSQGTHKLK